MSANREASGGRAMSDLLKGVRQTRSFRARDVPREVLLDILDVARWTGSAGNRQPWIFVVVTDAGMREALAAAAADSPHLARAPVVVAVVMDPLGPVTDSFDEGRVAERMLVTATAHELRAGVARPGREAQREIARLLAVPEPLAVRTLLSIGYPREGSPDGRKPGTGPPKPSAPEAARGRRALETFVRWERFA